MRGKSKRDISFLTSGNPARRIAAFTLPILAGDFLHTFYAMADAFIVGRWLGINGLAAVGVCVPLIHFVLGASIGIAAGAAVITAQRVGATGAGSAESDPETVSSRTVLDGADGIRRSVAAGLSICLYASVVLTALSLPLARPILSLMRTPAEILDGAAAYLVVIISGFAFFMFYNMLSGIIRAGGDSFSPFIFLVIGNICNIILDIVFIAVFSWGTRGAAAATAISEGISLILALRCLRRKFPSFLPQKRDWFPSQREVGAHLSLGIAMALQRSIVEVGNILVQTAMNGLGALAIAAVSAAQRVRGLNMMPLFSLSQAMTTYTAQNYGARKMDRVNKGILQACFISLGLGVFMAALNQFTGARIAALFLKDNAGAVALARQYILFTGYTVFILGIMLVFRSSLQGLGMKRAPILCGVMETVMSILAAFVLIPRLGFTGVCLVNPLSWLASGIPLYIAFGLLKRKKQIENQPGS